MSTPTTNDAPEMTQGRWPIGVGSVIVFGVLVLGYVLSAPLLHDGHGFPLRIQQPLWSAAREGAFSWILKPYFKLWGIEFPPSTPEPPRPNYE